MPTDPKMIRVDAPAICVAERRDISLNVDVIIKDRRQGFNPYMDILLWTFSAINGGLSHRLKRHFGSRKTLANAPSQMASAPVPAMSSS
jgi:hypothetical protein